MAWGSRLLFHAVLCAAWPATASADGAILAETLFHEGKALLRAGDLASACPKLAESYRQDPATGTLFFLALCQERSGRLASAWTNYQDVAARARAEGRRDRVAVAMARASALEPRLAKLVVQVSAQVAALPRFSVTLNDEPLPAAAWGTPVPVNRGRHVLEATAEGRVSFHHELTVDAEGELQRFVIPELATAPNTGTVEPLPAPSTQFPSPPARESRALEAQGLNSLQVVGLVAGAAGVLGLGLGTLFAVQAKSEYDESFDKGYCDREGCTGPGIAMNSEAVASGNRATALFAAGGALVGSGLLLYVVGSSKPASTALTLSPRLAGAEVGLNLGGRL